LENAKFFTKKYEKINGKHFNLLYGILQYRLPGSSIYCGGDGLGKSMLLARYYLAGNNGCPFACSGLKAISRNIALPKGGLLRYNVLLRFATRPSFEA